MGMIADDGD